MGWCVGLLFRVLRRVDHKKSWSYFVGALSAPLLNTIFFMGYIVLVFYKTDYIQERVASLGVANPLSFVIALVGVQGLIEIIVEMCIRDSLQPAQPAIRRTDRTGRHQRHPAAEGRVAGGV